jgi:hypothetical protein
MGMDERNMFGGAMFDGRPGKSHPIPQQDGRVAEVVAEVFPGALVDFS